jgi:hypothetical protein
MYLGELVSGYRYMNKYKKLAATLTVLTIISLFGCAEQNVMVTVKGMVMDAENQVSIPGVNVTAGTYSTITDDTGEYNLIMPSGMALFLVTALNYHPQDQQIIIKPEKVCYLSFGLVDNFYADGFSTGVIQGTVAGLINVDPIEGAQLLFTGIGQTYEVDSMHLGAYSIELPVDPSSSEMTYSLYVTANGYHDYSGSVTVGKGRYNTQNILMKP